VKRDVRTPLSSILTGSFFILMGVVWFLNNINLIRIYRFVWWPLILIIIGVIHFANRKNVSDFSGWFFILLGGFFLLIQNKIVNWEFVGKFWPVFLIVLGLSIILHRKNPVSESEPDAEKYNSITGIALFSGYKKKLSSKAFRRGKITALFGSAEIDLSKSYLNRSGAELELTAVFGGIDLIIPQDWNIELNSSAVFGGVGNKSQNPSISEGKILKIRANAVFGGIDIRN